MEMFDTDSGNVIIIGSKYENYKDNLGRPARLSIIAYSSMILDLINDENVKEIILQFTNDKKAIADCIVARYKKMVDVIGIEQGKTVNRKGNGEFITKRYILKKSDYFT